MGSLCGRMGPRQYVHPVGSNPGPDFCHLNHLASASAASASFAFAGPRQSADPCPLFVPCPLVSDMFGGFCPRGDLEHGAEVSHHNPVWHSSCCACKMAAQVLEGAYY